MGLCGDDCDIGLAEIARARKAEEIKSEPAHPSDGLGISVRFVKNFNVDQFMVESARRDAFMFRPYDWRHIFRGGGE